MLHAARHCEGLEDYEYEFPPKQSRMKGFANMRSEVKLKTRNNVS